MKITISTLPYLLLLCLFCSFSASAQNPYSVKGTMIDSASKSHLLNTSISVLNDKDSTLRKFTRADATGAWTINGLSKGKFLLLITYPGYADYVEPFILDSVRKTHDFGKIYMTLKSRLLQQVIIKGTAAAIKMKGDTTEFNAAAFKIQPNSKVEDLLKQLPGITVDKDGKITAQGEAVPKVLVDGEEFFGDDPTLVTKNLRADMVDKVQLYDKKSDQATFTGVDDGQKTKTINIKLKEDKKNGYFGKVEAGIGTDGFYSGQALFNKFKAKQKLSAYAIGSNTGKVGLGWEDQGKYGGTNNVQISDDGNSFISFGGGSDLDSYGGQYDGRGIPRARTGGIHYDNKWDADKQTINTNYKVGYLGVEGSSNNQLQINLPATATQAASIQFTNSDQNFNNSVFRQKVDGAYTTKPDTSSTLKITFGATLKNTKTNNDYFSTTVNDANVMLNSNKRSITNNTDAQIYDASAFYTRKFKKKGRTISWNVSESINNSKAKGYLYADAKFSNTTTGVLDSITDQYKTTDIKSSVLNSNIVYTEPLSKKLLLSLNYGLGLNNSSADRRSFNKVGSEYNKLDTTYSNDFTLNQLSNQVGAVFNYTTAKVILNFGSKATDVNFKQVNQRTGREYIRHFLNLNPQASITYKIAQQRTLRFNYSGNPTQPSIDQIQPILNNNDNLNISRGNPNLRPSFSHNFYTNYNSYKVLTDSWIGINANYSFTTSAIISNVVSNSATGKSTYQSVNLVDRNPYNLNISTYIDKKIKKLGFNVSPSLSFSNNVSYAYSNNVLNTTRSYNYSARMGFNKYVQKKYDFNVSAGPSYTVSGSSLYPERNNNGYGFRGWAGFNVYLPGKFQVGSDADYQYRGKTAAFDETFSRVLLNASISKTVLKQDNLKFSISGNDLLNQNSGFSQNAFGNRISRDTYTTIRRYFMFSIIWDFNKVGGGAPAAKN